MMVFTERDVSALMHEVLDEPLAAGPVLYVGGGLGDGEVGGLVAGLAAGRDGAGAGDPDGLLCVREQDSPEVCTVPASGMLTLRVRSSRVM
jgi:hypothetical protein